MTIKVKEDFVTTFISMDPGVNYVGISVIEASKIFDVKEIALVNNNRAFKAHEKELEKIHGSRTIKILNTISKVEELVEKYNIKKLVIEAPFYSHLTPAAYGSLLEVIYAIKYKIAQPNELEMHLVPPTVIKKLFSGKGNASKAFMKDFLITRLSKNDINMSYDVKDLSEHEIDSVAVGFTHWQENQER